jgi:hypothetical protein
MGVVTDGMREQPPLTDIHDWEQAERNARDWMRYLGFADAELTRAGSDAGIDVEGRHVLAQVKYKAHAIGRASLQQLVGARLKAHDKSLLFFTGSTYSAQAVEYANHMDIALFRYSVFGQVEALNSTAANLLARASRPQAETTSSRAPKLDPTNRQSVAHAQDDLIGRAEALLHDLDERDRTAVIDALLLGKVDEAAERYRASGRVSAFTARSRVRRLIAESPPLE